MLIYLNEALSIIKRAVRSIIDKTPARLLKEIILVDDHSSNGDKILFLVLNLLSGDYSEMYKVSEVSLLKLVVQVMQKSSDICILNLNSAAYLIQCWTLICGACIIVNLHLKNVALVPFSKF